MDADSPLKLTHTKQRIEALDADLSGSTFTDVNLTGAKFNDVNLTDAAVSYKRNDHRRHRGFGFARRLPPRGQIKPVSSPREAFSSGSRKPLSCARANPAALPHPLYAPPSRESRAPPHSPPTAS